MNLRTEITQENIGFVVDEISNRNNAVSRVGEVAVDLAALSIEEQLSFISAVASRLIDRQCKDTNDLPCGVFDSIHSLYRGRVHRAQIATHLIETRQLDVSRCDNSFCILKSIQRRLNSDC